MKKTLIMLLLAAAAAQVVTSCLGSSVEDEYKDWREANDQWFARQKDNTAFYTTVTAPWDVAGQVLMHWYNDTTLTRGNLKPLYSSTVDVKYRGMNKDAAPFDSSYLSTSPGDSIYRCRLNSGVIEGWGVAITQMHVGDSCRVVIPYALGYGSYNMSSTLPPYSMMVFDIKLTNIYAYERQ